MTGSSSGKGNRREKNALSALRIKLLEAWSNDLSLKTLSQFRCLQQYKYQYLDQERRIELIPQCRYEYAPNYYQRFFEETFWDNVKAASKHHLGDALSYYENEPDAESPVSYSYRRLCLDHGRGAKDLTSPVIEEYIVERIARTRRKIEESNMPEIGWNFQSLGLEFYEIFPVVNEVPILRWSDLTPWQEIMLFDPLGEFRFQIKVGEHRFPVFFPYRFIRALDAPSLVYSKSVSLDYKANSKLRLSENDRKRYPLVDVLKELCCPSKKIEELQNA